MNDGLDSGPRRPEDIFNDALELAPERRATFLEEHCGSDEDLRRRLAAMLDLAEAQPHLVRPPRSLAPDSILGKYRVLAEVGRGGMGVVYHAIDMELDRPVALKLLPEVLASDEVGLARFRREARTLASLNDEQIATLFTLEEFEGYHFLTMEFVEGRSLHDHLRDGPLRRETALSFARQIARALAKAHSLGIVHRDLKPSNIMVTPEGRIKILDFGIAKAFKQDASGANPPGKGRDALTLPAGTPGYMSPEQARGGPVDHRSDIWAFGAVLLECLTGKRPRQKTDHDPGKPPAGAGPDQRSLPRETPTAVRNLIGSCLEEDPDRRPASLADPAEILARELGRQGRWFRRPVALLLLGILAVAAFGSFWVLLGRKGEVVAVERLDEHRIGALDEEGNLIWQRTYEERIRIFNETRTVALTRSGQSPGRITLVTQPSPGQPAKLRYLDAGNGETIWSRTARWEVPRSAEGALYYWWCDFFPSGLFERPVPMAGLRDGLFYNFALRFFSQDGQVLGTYYHPGPVYLLGRVDPDRDGRSSILLAGHNSSARFHRPVVPFETAQHPPCLALLDDPRLQGQAFPYSEGIPPGRDWPGMPLAVEEAYLLIPLVHPDVRSEVPKGREILGDRPGGRFGILLTDGRALTLESDLRPVSCYVSLDSPTDSLRRRGEASFPPFLHIKRGAQELIDVPIEFD